MTTKQFYIYLAGVTMTTGGVLVLITQLGHFTSGLFPFVGLMFFLFFSILIYHLGKSSAVSSDKNRFTSVVMSMIFLKLILTIIIVLGFDKLVAKVQFNHVVSFLISYLFFTVYEVFFMSKLARLKAG